MGFESPPTCFLKEMSMKELKLRAWAVASKKMFLLNDEYDFINGGLYLPNTEIMQYTGIKDKTGKEIYEGDILIFSDERKIKYTVFYATSEVTFMLQNGDNFRELSIDYDKEVVGNIHQDSHLLDENPELLK